MVYWGESHRTMYDRFFEHKIALRTKDESNALAKHMNVHHPEDLLAMVFKVDKSWKNPLGRYIRESILSQEEIQERLMNSKSEWGSRNSIPRVMIQTDNMLAHQEDNQTLNNSSEEPLRRRLPQQISPSSRQTSAKRSRVDNFQPEGGVAKSK